MNFSLEEYNKQKMSIPEEEFYKDTTSLNYGQNTETPPEKIDKMVEEVNKLYIFYFFLL